MADLVKHWLRAPHCHKCNRRVDAYGYDLNLRDIVVGPCDVRTVYTGFVTIYVECHGQRWETREYYEKPYPWEQP